MSRVFAVYLRVVQVYGEIDIASVWRVNSAVRKMSVPVIINLLGARPRPCTLPINNPGSVSWVSCKRCYVECGVSCMSCGTGYVGFLSCRWCYVGCGVSWGVSMGEMGDFQCDSLAASRTSGRPCRKESSDCSLTAVAIGF